MRVLCVVAVVQLASASVVPWDAYRDHRASDLAGMKEKLQALGDLHVADNWRITLAEEASWGRGSLTSASDILGQLSLSPTFDSFPPLAHHLQQDFIRLLTANMNLSSTASEVTQPRNKREDRGVMYLPVRGGSAASCPSYADTVSASLTQMAFASMAVTVFNTVFNVVNNINNNNNNNNINSNNNVASNNANAATNNNNGNQVDVVLPPPIPGRRRRHGRTVAWLPQASTATRLRDAASYTSDSRHLTLGRNSEQQGVGGCLSRKTYARAALASLHALQGILLDSDFHPGSEPTRP